jgi:hypothetical protein
LVAHFWHQMEITILFLVNKRLILNWLSILKLLFFSNLAPSDYHIHIHHMNQRIWNLGFYHKLFLCWIHSFVLKHILHIIVLKTIYDLMSSVNTNMIGIPHKPLYFNLLSNNFRDCRKRVFLSFDSISFNIMICFTPICTIHSCFLWDYLRFLS